MPAPSKLRQLTLGQGPKAPVHFDDIMEALRSLAT
jgi:hypothetical protein